ncbi:MAG: penicillin acylase family protein, partial [Acidimicrobiia bacterium]|nr:penicillin acylase family protein [Acidimicrobiia bacterium]
DGTVTLPGLDDRVEIIRDTEGVPHIYASTTHDLFFAQGYTHAQDRFFQMDFWRHLGAGRLSEMFGESQVESDMFLRTFGWERIARREYENLPQEMRAPLNAYANGVNAYLAEESPGGISLEYTILGLQNPDYEMAEWTPIHTLTWAKVMAWDLGSNMEEEIDRARIAGITNVERADQLYPPYPDRFPVILEGGDASTSDDGADGELLAVAEPVLDDVAEVVEGVPTVFGHGAGIGSNSWVLSGDRTTTGAPLLANDTHLGIQMPSIWYQVGLHCLPRNPQCPYNVAGFTFPGAPGVIIGHNDRITWGVTTLSVDTQDLFIEELDSQGRIRLGDEWVQPKSRMETIEVANGEPVEFEVRTTRHGPIISDSYGALDDIDENGAVNLPERYAVSLKWQALEPSTVFQSILAINRAGNWDQFRRAVSLFDIAAQNFVYADVDGHIGYVASGETPVREGFDGRYPVAGWDPANRWTDVIPPADLPSILDPPSGYIVTANQPVNAPNAEPSFGADSASGHRAKRIIDLIEEKPRHGLASMTSIQLDTIDLGADPIVRAVVAVQADNQDSFRVQEVLVGWGNAEPGFAMDADSAGAAAYAVLYRNLLENTFDELVTNARLRAEGDEGFYGNFAGGRWWTVLAQLFERPRDPWWDLAGTEQVETRDHIIRQSLNDAAAELAETLGDDPGGWRWGDLHIAQFTHQSLGSSGIPPIEALFNRTAPHDVSGGGSIVNATTWNPAQGYQVAALPSQRMVTDPSAWGESTAIHTTGQSGHAFGSRYGDMLEDWTTGNTRPMRWSRNQVAAGSDAVLILQPGANAPDQ